ncbi:hypothetical protein [Phycicoccus sp.]|uniref:hypothetical protein n=1 Tax=Phycicoccus sp. TaxID=1902410 RepID=UPI002B625EEC|nr:hypothetical protein [Phycicoccus sp.]HMM95941.1 hypothetical protein [Phycicoccus sp.]
MSVLRPLRHEDLAALVVLQREAAVVALGHIFPQDTHPFPVDEVRQPWGLELEDPRDPVPRRRGGWCAGRLRGDAG